MKAGEKSGKPCRLDYGNPGQSISDIEKVELVFNDGVGYDSAKLIESVRSAVGLH